MTKAEFTKQLTKRQKDYKKMQEIIINNYVADQCLDSKYNRHRKRNKY